MFLSSFVFVNVFVFCFCHVLKLRSFNSQLHSALSVVCYYARGQEIGKYCRLPDLIRLQDSQDTTCSQSKKLINEVIHRRIQPWSFTDDVGLYFRK